MTIHCQQLATRRFRALLTFATTRAPQEGDCPFNEVTSTVLRHSLSLRSLSRRKSHAAAVLVSLVRVEVRRLVIVMMGRSVNSLGSRDMTGGVFRTGTRGCLIEVWWGRITATTGGFRCSCSFIISFSCSRGPTCSHTAVLFSMYAQDLTVGPSRTTRGCRGIACTMAGLAAFRTKNDIWGSGDDLEGQETYYNKKSFKTKTISSYLDVQQWHIWNLFGQMIFILSSIFW